jgi:hypothetical protein
MGCPLASRPAKGARAGLGGCAPVPCADPRTGLRYAHAQRGRRPIGEPRRREGAADGASTIRLAKDHAQRFW